MRYRTSPEQISAETRGFNVLIRFVASQPAVPFPTMRRSRPGHSRLCPYVPPSRILRVKALTQPITRKGSPASKAISAASAR